MSTEVLGVVAATLLTAMAVPQLLQVLRQRDAAGVSLLTWWLAAASGAVWLVYGVRQDAAAVVVGNVLFSSTVLPATTVVTAAAKRRSLLAAGGSVFGFAVGVALLAAGLPLPVLAALVVAVSVATTVPQAVRSVTNRASVSQVSVTTLLLLAGGQSLWLVYGLLRGDLSVVAANLIGVTLAGFTICVELRRKWGPAPESGGGNAACSRCVLQQFRVN